MKFVSEIINKLVQIKNKYKNYNSKELSIFIMKFCALPFNLVGIRVLSDCRLTLYSGTIGLMIVLDTFLCLYTTYYYWNINVISAIQPYTILSVAFPVN